ncbi:hypothetical protein MGAST_27725 [Mycobacterium gastri 'Wayne']|nr:hypothetical protein MGAST_27725 [Mycobacterium gastri 'Wayne']
MHYQEGGEIGLSEEDVAPARAAFAKYAEDGWVLTVARNRLREPVEITRLPVDRCARRN